MKSDASQLAPPAQNDFLCFNGITKSFGAVKVLKGVSFSVPVGGAVGLVGENGAGKSTLMNILGGNLSADEGFLTLSGKRFQPSKPLDAARQGVAFIHQELNLFPNLTVAENLFLTCLPRVAATPVIDFARVRQQSAVLLRDVGLQVSPGRKVATLSSGERQLVEIAKALAIDARLIIFDEPTTSLSPRETARLFELIGRLRARGIAMIYISHTLADVFRLCETIVVLRDGAVTGWGPAVDFSYQTLVTLMVGRTMNQLFPTRGGRATNQALLEVRGVSEPLVAHNISFTVRRGEILGISGLMGAGRTELARILFGLARCEQGEILLNGSPVHQATLPERIERGMAFLTEDRRAEGLCLDGSIADNLTLAALPHHASKGLGWLTMDGLREAARSIGSKVGLDAKSSDEQAVRTLSGGNQQKVVLGKWLMRNPKLLILDEPTRGIDVGAKFEIYRLMLELADAGTGILVISSELEELIGLCDRILVLRAGAIVDDVSGPGFDRERILGAALGSQPAVEAQS